MLNKIRSIDYDTRMALMFVVSMINVAVLIAVGLSVFGGFALADAIFGGLLLSVIGTCVVIMIICIWFCVLGLTEDQQV